MRAKNTKKYAKYYLLLSHCIRHYNNYQNKLKEKSILELKIKINNLQNLITDNINNLQNIITEKDNKLSSLKDKINFYDNLWKNNKSNNNIDTLK